MFRKPTLRELLALWWVKKYRLPWNHELFQERTIFDLYVEFKLDKFFEKPIEAHRNASGDIQFQDTGDEVIDRWEEQIAKGETPDLWEAFDDESLKHLEKLRVAAERRNPYASMKDTYERMEREARAQGLTVGKQPVPPRLPEEPKRDIIIPETTFGFDEDDE
jgi:hypothetical protein